MKTVLSLVPVLALTALLSCPLPAMATDPSPGDPAAHQIRFDFHNSFLMNLHGMLLAAARREAVRTSLPWSQALSAAEHQALDEALAYYRVSFERKDALFSRELSSIKAQLASAGDGQTQAIGLGLAPEHERLLSAIAPVYQRLLWPTHQNQNRRWIQAAQVLNQHHGAAIQAGMSRWLGGPNPAQVRLDAVAYSAHWAGAYTSRGPAHSVVETSRPDYGGLAALEMIHHEASHAGTTDALMGALEARLPPAARKSDLWHAIQFYTVGDVVKQTLAQNGIRYTPYADWHGLYAAQGPWSAFKPLLEGEWEAYLRGQLNRDEALSRMAARLAP